MLHYFNYSFRTYQQSHILLSMVAILFAFYGWEIWTSGLNWFAHSLPHQVPTAERIFTQGHTFLSVLIPRPTHTPQSLLPHIIYCVLGITKEPCSSTLPPGLEMLYLRCLQQGTPTRQLGTLGGWSCCLSFRRTRSLKVCLPSRHLFLSLCVVSTLILKDPESGVSSGQA